MFRIEQAIEGDRQAVLAVTLAAYSEYKSNFTTESWQAYGDNISQTIVGDLTNTIFVARDNGKILGSVVYCEPNSGARKNDFPEMRLLAVPPEFRNLGIAGALIEECEHWASQAGVLTLHTTKLMQTAKAMYERRGYVRYPDIDFVPRPDFVVWGYKKVLVPCQLRSALITDRA